MRSDYVKGGQAEREGARGCPGDESERGKEKE